MSYINDPSAPGSTRNTAVPGPADTTAAPGSNTYTHTQPTTSSSRGTNAGASTGRKLEGLVSGLHGAGEQIRGQFNMAVDTVMHDREGQARNQGVIDRGREEYNTGRIIENPEKHRYVHGTYQEPMVGTGTTAAAGTTHMGTQGRSVGLTEGVYGEPGPTNAGRQPGSQHVAGGPAVGGGHYVDETRRRV